MVRDGQVAGPSDRPCRFARQSGTSRRGHWVSCRCAPGVRFRTAEGIGLSRGDDTGVWNRRDGAEVGLSSVNDTCSMHGGLESYG
jgi:hypothetical protein